MNIEAKEAEGMSSASLSVGLAFTLVFSSSLISFCVGGGDPVSSLSPAAGGKDAPAADGKEAEGMDTEAKEAADGKEAEDMDTEAKEAEDMSFASLSVGLAFTLVFSSQIFCVGGGDPVSSLSPATGGKEAEAASLSMRLRLVVEATSALVVVLPLPPPLFL